MKTDVLIVGSGCSGLYCALQLPRDQQITIVTKRDVESSDSFLAQGGICMLKDESDYDSYFEDTLKAERQGVCRNHDPLLPEGDSGPDELRCGFRKG